MSTTGSRSTRCERPRPKAKTNASADGLPLGYMVDAEET